MKKIILYIVLSLTSIFAGYILTTNGFIGDQSKALEECIDEVSNKCSGTIQYAIALERENSRLNAAKNSCK
tara:strand:+ start:3992 stop:4204 length:213 start_codon:yes stop_codon:yes gene_type:complete